MKEKISPFIKGFIDNPFIMKQYIVSNHEREIHHNDPLMEDSHEVTKGLIHKYANRALIKVSYQCASHCRFCTRIRQIGNPEGTLNEKDIDDIITYLNHHPEIEDVILSGGDPLYTPQITSTLLNRMKSISSIRVMRIGTRLPFHLPNAFQSKLLLNLLEQVNEIGHQKPFYLLIHIEHPDELTEETERVILQLRQLKVTILSQTVFLKNINDHFDTLYKMFKRLYHLGVIPYYLYHCDNVKGLEHFRGDMEKEKEIAQQLRASLSGIATPLFVEDIEGGYGKIPI